MKFNTRAVKGLVIAAAILVVITFPSGTSATHARNQNSKPGNARIRIIAENIAKPALNGESKLFLKRVNLFIPPTV